MTEKSWRVEVTGACLGSGLCTALAPAHFELIGGRAEAVGGPIESEDELGAVVGAANICPAAAISVVDVIDTRATE